MDFTPSFSPDGRRIIFASKRSGNSDLWVYEITTKAHKQLTDFRGRDYSPAFSPDGSRIAFVTGLTGADGKENLEIFLMDAAGENEKRLSTNLGIERYVTWSPDGRSLVFTSAEVSSGAERLRVVDVSTGKDRSLEFDRTAIEGELGAQAKGTMFFKLLPQAILRKMYPDTYFGKERYPDWTY